MEIVLNFTEYVVYEFCSQKGSAVSCQIESRAGLSQMYVWTMDLQLLYWIESNVYVNHGSTIAVLS